MTRCDDEYDDDVRRDDLSHAFVCLPGFHCLSFLGLCLWSSSSSASAPAAIRAYATLSSLSVQGLILVALCGLDRPGSETARR